MSLAALMTQAVTVERAPLVDGHHGDDVRDWDNATTTPAVAWIAQENRAEVLTDRDAEISHWTGYFPVGTDLAAADRVRRGDELFEVDGPPNIAPTPAGPHHVEATLRIVTG